VGFLDNERAVFNISNYKNMFNNIEGPPAPKDPKEETAPTEHKEKEEKSMTSHEYRLRKMSPYDLSDVNKVLSRHNNKKR
jgi:hypothetical protein